MKMQERITLKRKITEIALNEAIRGWQAPVQGPRSCPFCQSDRVYRRMQSKNGMTCGCKDCGQPFSEELIQQCRCVRPGVWAKCVSCPQYQTIRELMKFNIDQLRNLSGVEVEKIMTHPDFYQEHFSLRQILPQVKLRHYADRQATDGSIVTEVVNQPLAEGDMAQLSLFE